MLLCSSEHPALFSLFCPPLLVITSSTDYTVPANKFLALFFRTSRFFSLFCPPLLVLTSTYNTCENVALFFRTSSTFFPVLPTFVGHNLLYRLYSTYLCPSEHLGFFLVLPTSASHNIYLLYLWVCCSVLQNIQHIFPVLPTFAGHNLLYRLYSTCE
jgi:hypothetical protein